MVNSSLRSTRTNCPPRTRSDEKPRPLIVTRGSRERVDLQVIPLNAIRGRVYLDRNRNGLLRRGRRRPECRRVGERIRDGNRPPRGRTRSTTSRRDATRFASTCNACPKASRRHRPLSSICELTPDSPLLGIDFTVEKKDMPIIMREIPR